MANSIVVTNVSQQVGPTPSKLQGTGAFISQGGTTTAQFTQSLLTQLSDLTPLLPAAMAVTSVTSTGTTATVTAAVAHGITNGDTFLTVISGASPAGYNGTVLATITGTSTFTYVVASGLASPATGSIFYTRRNVAELTAMATTFFGQGSSQSVYVLELGAGEPAAGVTALSTFITANPAVFYSYLMPAAWSSEATYLTFLAGFESTTAKTYFFTTMTTGNYTSFTALMKCVVGLVPAPSTPTVEFSMAAPFWVALHYAPSSTNKVTPFAFSFLFGVTPWPASGQGVTLAALKAAGVNYIGVGSEGGISNTILLWGTTMDGNDFTYWYSVDWVQINSDLDLSNAIINGSNNPTNPLYYNQDGINRLQANEVATMSSGITFGLVLGDVVQTQLSGTDFAQALENGAYVGKTVINAVPFIVYSQANTGDYKIGKYAGLSVAYVPARGFIQIVLNIIVSSFIAT